MADKSVAGSVLEKREVIAVDLDDLIIDTFDRTDDDMKSIRALAASMKALGQVNPLGIFSAGDGKYKVIYGKRRVAGAKSLGWKKLDAVVLKSPDVPEIHIISDNLYNRRPNPVLEARTYKKLLDDGVFKTAQELAETMGVGKTHVSDCLKTLSLPAETQEQLLKGIIPLKPTIDAVKGGKKSRRIPSKKDVKEAIERKRFIRLPPEHLIPKGKTKPIESIAVHISKKDVKAQFVVPFSSVKKQGLLKVIQEEMKLVTDKVISEGIAAIHTQTF